MNARVILSVVLVSLGFIIAAIPKNTTQPYKLTAEQMLQEIQGGKQFISTDEVAQYLIEKNPSIQLIDVRSQDEFEKNGLPEVINIPLTSLLLPDSKEALDQPDKIIIFYSNGNTQAVEAWMLTRQLGMENVYVMQGGINYWIETVINPVAPPVGSADDEIARYDFRKGAGMQLGGAAPAVATQAPGGTAGKAPKAPAPGAKKKKKGVSGGCS
jgi:rhodanese-related sulfurtransferase